MFGFGLGRKVLSNLLHGSGHPELDGRAWRILAQAGLAETAARLIEYHGVVDRASIELLAHPISVDALGEPALGTVVAAGWGHMDDSAAIRDVEDMAARLVEHGAEMDAERAFAVARRAWRDLRRYCAAVHRGPRSFETTPLITVLEREWRPVQRVALTAWPDDAHDLTIYRR